MSSPFRSTKNQLGEFLATAIAGNDLLSSSLYVSGIAALFAGTYAPLVLLVVGFVLFVYRSVYREVVGAMPINGGAYNALLNGTIKPAAAIAGTLTILSYIATAAISAKIGVSYLLKFFQFLAVRFSWPVDPTAFDRWLIPTVIGVLFLFAMLVIIGSRGSSKIAGGIFALHLATLSSFILTGIWLIASHGNDFHLSNVLATQTLVATHGGLLKTLFLAFSVCLLGISGFESSANYVEEQKPGVFPKTLRNLTLGAIIVNPLIAAILLSLLPLSQIIGAKEFALADAALRIGGAPFLALIAMDAFLVLCGAVLTAYVGVSGLAHRMALDDCLPTAFAKENKRGAHPRIVWIFFLLCASILIATHGNLLSLAGVYTVSFLSVMTLFAASNLLLRQTREDLKRPYKAPLTFVVIAFLATLAGLMGTISLDPTNTGYFLLYFVPLLLLSFFVIERTNLYEALAHFFRFWPTVKRFFERRLDRASRDRIYVFIHHVHRLYRILKYIHENENGSRVTLVHCRRGSAKLTREVREVVGVLKESGFFPNFKIEVEYLNRAFSPQAIDDYATTRRIQKNKIFIGSIHKFHKFNYEDLGGVRIIL